MARRSFRRAKLAVLLAAALAVAATGQALAAAPSSTPSQRPAAPAVTVSGPGAAKVVSAVPLNWPCIRGIDGSPTIARFNNGNYANARPCLLRDPATGAITTKLLVACYHSNGSGTNCRFYVGELDVTDTTQGIDYLVRGPWLKETGGGVQTEWPDYAVENPAGSGLTFRGKADQIQVRDLQSGQLSTYHKVITKPWTA